MSRDQCSRNDLGWKEGDPPREPAPEIVMDPRGIYWRRYPDMLSMVPVSADNDPLREPLVVYRPVGECAHEHHTRDEMFEAFLIGVYLAGDGPEVDDGRELLKVYGPRWRDEFDSRWTP